MYYTKYYHAAKISTLNQYFKAYDNTRWGRPRPNYISDTYRSWQDTTRLNCWRWHRTEMYGYNHWPSGLTHSHHTRLVVIQSHSDEAKTMKVIILSYVRGCTLKQMHTMESLHSRWSLPFDKQIVNCRVATMHQLTASLDHEQTTARLLFSMQCFTSS